MHESSPPSNESTRPPAESAAAAKPPAPAPTATSEIGGRESGLDPTRYGDWEKNGRCIDF